ncbi:MAG TPA: cysteine dioxygenase family protein [bacterium]|nr:cysteine dioxygenase family protein [bacterium]
MPAQAQAVAVAQDRRQAVTETIARIRKVERERGVNRPALQEIKQLMLDLAAHKSLFPREDFPTPDGRNMIYRLAEDADHRYALYMSCGIPGKKVPPHNHTTWAVIVGVEGEEENFFYERTDDGSVPGRGTLRQVREEVVRPGTGVTLMPEDIHHIQVGGSRPTLHLHMYGLSLEHLPTRVTYDMAQGTYQVYPASPNIVYLS